MMFIIFAQYLILLQKYDFEIYILRYSKKMMIFYGISFNYIRASFWTTAIF